MTKNKRPWNYRKVEIPCAHCGKIFLSPPSHKIKRRCCSRICAGLVKRLQLATHYRCYKCKKMVAAEDFHRNNSRSNGRCSRCKKCQLIDNFEYRGKHREKVRTYTRNYRRRTRIGQGGIKPSFSRVQNKRPYPQDECCELCRRHRPMKLVYHHWNDQNFALGIWICRPCHSGVHFVERVGAKPYLNLKKRINGEVSLLLATPNHTLFSSHPLAHAQGL